MPAVVERARDDIRNDRLWKARDRLASALKADPANQELLELLGEVHFRMGDLPNAGRHWILTGHTGPDVDAALAAFEERWGRDPAEKLRMVPLRTSPDDFAGLARERLAALEAEAATAGPQGPGRAAGADERDAPTRWSHWLGVAAAVALGPGLWVLGVVTAIVLLVRALG
jgi:hypothetical protein